MSHQSTGNPANLTRFQLQTNTKEEKPEEKEEKFDEDISLEEALSTL
tara:strand:- start:102 stop:242 length:141 start_codon:yes stop_codon:yes gene_type:complete